jgi:hypothetical protein
MAKPGNWRVALAFVCALSVSASAHQSKLGESERDLVGASVGREGGQQQQQPPASGQPAQTPPPQQPTFRTGVNFVRVDAIVTDKQGNPVPDLKATDFEVLEDGKPQTIESFRFVKVDGTAPLENQRPIRTRQDEERAAANEDARIFVFFLDDYHVRLGNSMAARKPLAEFITTYLAPGDLVSVMYPLSPLDTVALTRDHQAVIRAIESFQGRKFN